MEEQIRHIYFIYAKNELRVLAAHYDNTWNSSTLENIRKVLQVLNIDLFTLVIDNKESDDIFKSFFLAGVPEIDAATDLGFTETLYRESKYKIKYVLEGHSFLTGITPLGKIILMENIFHLYIRNLEKENWLISANDILEIYVVDLC